jgi:hypothetical protein
VEREVPKIGDVAGELLSRAGIEAWGDRVCDNEREVPKIGDVVGELLSRAGIET